MEGFAEGYAVGQGNAYNGNGYGGFGGWGEWIWIIVLFALWQNGGFGFGGNGRCGVADQYVLNSDFATIQRQLSDGFGGVEKGIDTIRNGMCDGFYTEAQLVNGVNMNIAQNGYESRLATQNLGSQLASCCCDIREGIAGVNYNNAINTNAITKQISDCCCTTERQIERGFCDTNFAAQAQHAQTMTAIDKVGDRIIDYLSAEKAAALRDENQALRLAASQSAQNAYLINQLRPCPSPAYVVPNPFCCGCNNVGTNYTI